MPSLQDLQRAQSIELSTASMVESFYKGTDAIQYFVEFTLIPILNGQQMPNDKEQAILGTYYRMYAWLRSLVALNAPVHFQAVASAARSLFELLLDIKMLQSDQTGNIVEKFHAFPEVEKYRSAKKLVSFCDSHPSATIDCSRQRSFLNGSTKASSIEATIVKHWGRTNKGDPNWPDHWSGKKVPARAYDLGQQYEELYAEVYPFLSWHIHSGSTGYAGLGEKAIEASFGLMHSIAQRVFLEATTICTEVFRLDLVIKHFHRTMDELSVSPGKFLTDKQIEILKLQSGGSDGNAKE